MITVPAASDFVSAAEHGERQVQDGCRDDQPAPAEPVVECEIQTDQADEEEKQRSKDAFGISSLAIVAYSHGVKPPVICVWMPDIS